MGGFTIFSALIDNPSMYTCFKGSWEDEIGQDYNPDKYKWNKDIRVITPDGSVTDIGVSSGYGYVTVKGKNYDALYCENLVSLGKRCSYNPDLESNSPRGVVIHNLVYKYLKEHKSFKDLSNYNLYDLIVKFIEKPQKNVSPFSEMQPQDVYIYSKDYIFERITDTDLTKRELEWGKKKTDKQRILTGWKKNKDTWIRGVGSDILEDSNDYTLVNPEINDKNKKRIKDIIDKFVTFALNSNNSSVKNNLNEGNEINISKKRYSLGHKVRSNKGKIRGPHIKRHPSGRKVRSNKGKTRGHHIKRHPSGRKVRSNKGKKRQ